jgi:DNA-binding SARP family transcriptional activator/tetratricopeptide (TPR) repeat protein
MPDPVLAGPGGGVRFELLGPLQVVDGAGAVRVVPAAKQRIVLAALLLSAGEVVPAGVLAEALWDADPPPNAAAAMRTYVMRLRHALGPAGARVLGRPGGWAVQLGGPAEFDLAEVEELWATARAAARAAAGAGDWRRVSSLLGRALGMWRGEPLADVPSAALARREAGRLTELRSQLTEARIDADLRLGRHRVLVPELQRLAAEHPLREHVWVQLMLACYRSGRQAAALAAYTDARAILAGELGVEPGPELREIHRQVLAADPVLTAGLPGGVVVDLVPEPRADAEPEPARPETPHQLPAGVRHFAGRDEQLSELAGLLEEVGQPGRTAVISAIGGTAGIGKTALAVHWAHQVVGEFPDGQLYANLRGFDPSGPPVAAEAVVRDFLGALGVPLARIPAGAEAQAALYRTVLAPKRVLIVLDNARDADQVRPLLPGASGCFVLVTSRARLVSLAASEGGHLLTLDLPSLSEARELLSRRLGAELVAAEPEAADELIRMCARLPLALGIVAARAAASPGVRLAALAAELADTPGRLDVLDAGTPACGVRAAFSWSYRRLSAAAARMFRLLGVHPWPDISAAAAASLAGLPRPAARSTLRELAQAGLIAEHIPGRFALHDLVRIYAAEQAEANGAGPSSAAFNRLLDHYLLTGYAAALVLNRHRTPIAVPAAQPGVVPEEITEHGQALAWFETERQGLEAAITAAAAAGLDLYAWQLAWTLADFLNWRGYWRSHIAIQTIALAAAQRLGQSAAQASVHGGLSRAYAQLGQPGEAIEHLHRALALYREMGDLVGQGHAYMGLAVALEQQGRPSAALRHGRQALDLYRRGHDQPGEAAALNAVGWCHALLGEYGHAFRHSQQALALHKMLDNQAGAAFTWDTLGYVHHHLDEYGRAEACYRSALELFRDLGIAYSTADTLTHLGEIYREAGDTDAARDAWEQALSILRDLDHADAADVQAKLAGLMAASRTVSRPSPSPITPAGRRTRREP